MSEFEDFENEFEETRDNLTVKLVEVYQGKIRHFLVDGLYLHSGDLIALFESDLEAYEREGMISEAEFTERLINRIRLMIVNRNNYE